MLENFQACFCCFLTLLIFCPVGWSQQNWPSQQGRKLAKSGSNKKKFQFCQSYSYVNRKVWYHQIWIPSNLGFIVSDLVKVPKYVGKLVNHKIGLTFSMCQSWIRLLARAWISQGIFSRHSEHVNCVGIKTINILRRLVGVCLQSAIPVTVFPFSKLRKHFGYWIQDIKIANIILLKN